MDVTNRKLKSEEMTKVKRPFDVAFLILPDEKKKKLIPDDSDEEIEVGTNQPVKAQIFDDPGLVKMKNLDELRGPAAGPAQKSAFTKVNLKERLSPNLSLSPDLSYQHSLSPSPPIRYHSQISPSALFKNHAYHLPEAFSSPGMELMQPQFAKMRPMVYRPDLQYNYQQFSGQQEVRSPAAAALLTSLLPPSLAALSLPAQNVCAKCNISFRMTSDLVYHMRSHHKNDSVDMSRRRREDKLKCPVCSESFRERHHLTRHMTAHQDKEEDEANVKKKCVSIV